MKDLEIDGRLTKIDGKEVANSTIKALFKRIELCQRLEWKTTRSGKTISVEKDATTICMYGKGRKKIHFIYILVQGHRRDLYVNLSSRKVKVGHNVSTLCQDGGIYIPRN